MTSLPIGNHDVLLEHKNPMMIRLNDAHHSQINVGQVVELSGHDTIMDRQKFTVVAKTEHQNLHQALNSIEHSNLSARDKIKMHEGFVGMHGEGSEHKPAVSFHLEPHAAPHPGSFNRSIGGM